MSLIVLIPAHNVAQFIEEAVASVFDQDTDKQTTVIVANDGSTDETARILAELERRYERLQVVAHENIGVSQTRNRLISLIPDDADFVTFLDADDAMAPGRIARDTMLLRDNPDLELIYGRLQLVSNLTGRLADVAIGSGVCLRGVSVTTATFRADILRSIGEFDARMTHAEDLDFLLRFFEVSDRYQLLNGVSVLYRRTEADTATSDSDALRRGMMQALLQHARRCRQDASRSRVDGIFEMERLQAAYESERRALNEV